MIRLGKHLAEHAEAAARKMFLAGKEAEKFHYASAEYVVTTKHGRDCGTLLGQIEVDERSAYVCLPKTDAASN